MSEEDMEKTRTPRRSLSGAAAAERRRERLAQALRANLGRRKAQARARDVTPPSPEAPPKRG